MTSNLNVSLEVTNGPSREDMIFRGLIDGQPKLFEFVMKDREGNVLMRGTIPVEIIGARNWDDCSTNQQRHDWDVQGFVFPDHKPPKWQKAFFITILYDSKTRKGRLLLPEFEQRNWYGEKRNESSRFRCFVRHHGFSFREAA